MSVLPSRTGPLLTGAGVSPGETPPTLSELAQQHTPNGAEMFAAYFFHALDWSLATTDSYLIAQVSAPSCSACTRYIDELTTLQAAGSRITGGRLTIYSVAPGEGTLVRSDYVVIVTVNQNAAEVVSSQGSSSPAAPGEVQVPNRLYVSWVSGKWLAMEIGTAS